MSSPYQDLQSFSKFALDHLGGGAVLTLDELFELWRIENPAATDYSENVAAISGAIEDYKNGDRGRVAGELSRELRQQLETPQ